MVGKIKRIIKFCGKYYENFMRNGQFLTRTVFCLDANCMYLGKGDLCVYVCICVCVCDHNDNSSG